jgi:histidyl-tRNA synthetase
MNLVRGMFDLSGAQLRRHRFVASAAESVCIRYGFEELQTPLVEHRGTFDRGSEWTKEMFGVQHALLPGNDELSLVLRPEGTAGAARMMAGLGNEKRARRFYYCGAMFRCERPQRGRSRQFHQFGAEIFNDESALADAQALAMCHDLLEELGIGGADVLLRLNTLGGGDDEARGRFEQALREFFERRRHLMAEASVRRLDDGASVLRVLDALELAEAQAIGTESVPSVLDFLPAERRQRFKDVCNALDAIGIDYQVDRTLARGLDYYTGTVFEYVYAPARKQSTLGSSQATLIAGGRYDKLVRELGGIDMPAFGWAAGIDRLALALDDDASDDERFAAPASVAVVSAGNSDSVRLAAFKLAVQLRRRAAAGEPFGVMFHPTSSLARQLKRASSTNARLSLIVGDNEVVGGTVILKDMKSGESATHALDDAIDRVIGEIVPQ